MGSVVALAVGMLALVACAPRADPAPRPVAGAPSARVGPVDRPAHSPRTPCRPTLPPPGDYATGHLPQLVPPGPDLATVCRYARQPGTERLVRSATLTTAGRTTLATRLNALAPQTAVTEPLDCSPATDNGSADEVLFHYPDGTIVPVDVTLTGCPVATSTASDRVLVLFGPSTDTGHAVLDQLGAVVGR